MRLEFHGKRVSIRPLRSSDAPALYENVKDREIVTWTVSIPHPYPKDGALKFIRKTRYNIRKRKSYTFAIVLKETGTVIGVVELMTFDWENKNAEIGYWLGKKRWGEGLMTEAVRLILNFGFGKLRLHRIYAKLFEENTGSATVLEKCGFTLEGRMREARYRYGKWHDALRYGILESEF
jgi:RimJ/RimL family protein N-acetyltransferase